MRFILQVLGEGTDCMKKDELPNIDDISNPLEVVEYVDDIYQYYWAMEVMLLLFILIFDFFDSIGYIFSSKNFDNVRMELDQSMICMKR